MSVFDIIIHADFGVDSGFDDGSLRSKSRRRLNSLSKWGPGIMACRYLALHCTRAHDEHSRDLITR